MKTDPERILSIWKMIAVACIGVIATGASAWMVFDQGVVGREEVSRMIAEQSPYAVDRQIVRETLVANKALLEKVAAEIGEIKIEQARQSERIELILKMKEKH